MTTMRTRRGRSAEAPDAPDISDAAAKALGSDAYDEQWLRLDDFLRYNPGARHRRRLVLDALRRHAPGARGVLDVGCGLGEMTEFLAEHFPRTHFTGIDLSPVAVEACVRRLPAHDFAVVDIVADDIPGPVDAIVCSELLEHLDAPAAALHKIAGSLRPGGAIVVTVPNGQVFDTERAVGHVEHPEPATLRAWCAESGLDLLELRRWGWPGYLMLKRAANIDAERAMSAFGSGTYSWVKRRANDAAYAAVGVGSFRDHERGPQTVLVARRPS